MSDKDRLFGFIEKLGQLRGIPQLLYCDNTFYAQWIRLKDQIVLFKATFPDAKEIDFILHSGGGTADDAYRIIRTLRQNFEVVNVVIPFWAKSAATLLSLGGTTIIMSKTAEFGPIDIQLPKAKEDNPGYDYESALNDEVSLQLIENRAQIRFAAMFIDYYENERLHIPKTDLSKQLMEHISKFYEPLLSQINPYKLGEKKRKSDISKEYANKILSQYHKLNPKKQAYLVDYLVTSCPEHGFIIDFPALSGFLPNVTEAKNIGNDSRYETLLDKISCFFIKDETDIRYIGFIPELEEQLEEENKEDQTDNPFTAAITQISTKERQ